MTSKLVSMGPPRETVLSRYNTESKKHLLCWAIGSVPDFYVRCNTDGDAVTAIQLETGPNVDKYITDYGEYPTLKEAMEAADKFLEENGFTLRHGVVWKGRRK